MNLTNKLWHAPLDAVLRSYSPVETKLLGENISLIWNLTVHGMAAQRFPATLCASV